jgi:hypothetical protein
MAAERWRIHSKQTSLGGFRQWVKLISIGAKLARTQAGRGEMATQNRVTPNMKVHNALPDMRCQTIRTFR